VGQRLARGARARREVEHTLAGQGVDRLDRRAPPPPVQTEAEHVVGEVVVLGDPVEHAGDGGGILVEVGAGHAPILTQGVRARRHRCGVGMSLDGVGPGWHAPSMTEPAAVVDHAAHTPYTRPGRFAPLLAALPTDPPALSEVARNVIVHYRSADRQLPQETDDDIDLRWLEDMLATDQRRHGTPLAEHRAPEQRLQGCCRDHTLLCVAALREHGLPARSRLGFAGYFQPGEHADHVVAEVWLEGRWRRFDPEIDAPREALPQPMDMPTAQPGSTGFVTAAQAWVGY